MKRIFVAALLAASLGMAGAATAQTSADGHKASAHHVAEQIGVRNLTIKDFVIRDFGYIATGELADGTVIGLIFDGKDRLSEVKARGLGKTFPAGVVRSLVPQAVLANPSWPADGQLTSVRFEPTDQIKVQGRLADGRDVHAVFTSGGDIITFDAHR